MRALTADDLLVAAERLRVEPLPRRGAALLAIAANTSTSEAMQLTIGERDDRLLAVRAATFGRTLTGVAGCPACHERCEIEVDANALRSSAGESMIEIESDGWRVRARLPNSDDVAAAAGEHDAGAARRALLRRCVVEPDGELPAEIAALVEETMERSDPRADIRLALVCPACGASWENAFDVVSFFEAEIRVAAERLISEVHTLARAYGWREADILAMTPGRRLMYLELVSP